MSNFASTDSDIGPDVKDSTTQSTTRAGETRAILRNFATLREGTDPGPIPDHVEAHHQGPNVPS